MPFVYKDINNPTCKKIIVHQYTKNDLKPTDKWQIHAYKHDEDDITIQRHKEVEITSCNNTHIFWTDINDQPQSTPYGDIIKISTYDSSKEGGKRKYKKSKKQTKSKKSKKSNKSKKNKNQRK